MGWKKESSIWSRINPLLSVPSFRWLFRMRISLYRVLWTKTKEEMEELGWDMTVSQDARMRERTKESRTAKQLTQSRDRQHNLWRVLSLWKRRWRMDDVCFHKMATVLIYTQAKAQENLSLSSIGNLMAHSMERPANSMRCANGMLRWKISKQIKSDKKSMELTSITLTM